MKKLFVCMLLIVTAVSLSCSSKKSSEKDDDNLVNDSNILQDSESDSDAVVTDSVNENDADLSDLPESDIETGDVDSDVECPPYYVRPDYDPEQCVPECTEDTIEGFNGYCEEGKVCQQGICITDRCLGYECPENSTCSVKNDAAFCQCDPDTQMSNNKCCPLNSTNKSGICTCDAGYEKVGTECKALASNKCVPNPCEGSGKPLHKNTCVLDASVAGYHCECNENYVASGNSCTLIEVDICTDGLQCLSGYCVPFDLSNEQCIEDEDCREFPGATTTCSAPNAAGGVCIGCSVPSDCPGNTQCYETYGTCALMCDDNTDCPYGKCYGTGYCGQKKCYSNEDCFGGTICIDPDGTGEGMCQRIPCKETACSKTNPGGTCENASASCIGGECVASCTPNPCKEVNRGTCEIKLGVPTCVCDAGTYEVGGKCEPKTLAVCPGDLTCVAGFCADKTDPGFVCVEKADCEDVDLTCSPMLPSGICSGCTYASECPHGGAEVSECLSGYCLRKCADDVDCNAGMKCLSGHCGKKDCSKPADCPAEYTCLSSGKCGRIPCS